MKISLNTISFINQHYNSAGNPAPEGVDALAEKIGAQLGAIEEVIPFGERFKDARIVRIVSCDDHPNADRLHVCKIDDDGQTPDVERDENGYVQVVCGAPNARQGITVVWLPPGATVPSTIDDDPFVLEARALRGVVSNGMLASPRELTIGDSHEGILEITDERAQPGMTFAEAYNLHDDMIIDIENKMFTHRPDCFGFLGVARELEGIQHRAYKSPDWYTVNPAFPGVEADTLPLTFRNEIPELVPRFVAVTMRDVQVHDSPVWLQVELAKAGIRPINNIVDYTNFFMLETGQPLHAYDYDKVVAQDAGASHATIVARKPRDGEKVRLLNGKEITPRDEAIMIATNDKLIGAGGVMGGADTEVDENTKNVIIECANFDMYSIRRTSMAHGLFTDAVTRFNKGQSPLQNRAVLAKIVDEIRQYAGGKVASEIIDDNHLSDEVMQRQSLHAPVRVSRTFINTRLGFDLSADDMAKLLRNVEFDVEVQDDQLTVTAPFWRTDIAIPEDVVEEVGRLYGFDKLPLELPRRDLTPTQKDVMLELKARVRAVLSGAGANELLTYSFVHGNLLETAGQDKNLAFQLSNALSPDLQYFRLSLTPSLLERVHPNSKAGYGQFGLFEINKVHGKTEMDDEGLPAEFTRVGFVFAADEKTAKQEYAGAAYYQSLKYLTTLLDALGLSSVLTLKPLSELSFDGHPLAEQMAQPFDPARSAAVLIGTNHIGIVGEYRRSVQKSFKLPAFTAGFELSASGLMHTTGRAYVPMSKFPKVTQDITLRVPAELAYGEIYGFVDSFIANQDQHDYYASVHGSDIYQGEDQQTKNITFRVVVGSDERTLTDDEVNKLLDQTATAAREQFGAGRV